jgi:signal recognition particle subunit SRP54
VLSLVEEATRQVDQDKAAKLAKKLKTGKGFNLEDLREQLGQMQKMGGMASLMDKLPGMGKIPEAAKSQVNDKELGRMIAIINSMTPGERRHPDLIKGSRKRRIAAGSGTQVQDMNRLLKQHMQMSKAMKQFSKGGMGKLMRAMKGKLPGGGLPF